MKFQRRQGFTIVELLTVIAIIAILMGILVPTISFVRNTAREAKQKTQLATIDMAIMAFKGDHGYYPPSDWRVPNGDYCGAQKLAEALVGWDLLGFHPDSEWQSNGRYINGNLLYEKASDPDPDVAKENLEKRTGPYLELSTANAFRLGISALGARDGLFDDPAPLRPDTFVLCDSFGAKKISIGTKTVMVGTPILYFRANTSSKNMSDADFDKRIYSWNNNLPIISLGRLKDRKQHPIWDSVFFYDYITDPKVTAIDWPYRPDSYILISAGVDGLYGTNDDICNF